ncbi:hypothetical protein ABW20_dc0100906 [Dactylellina cionopaga]|nr:hypothetical protein ABW20_dc0100906 [Dactylellina cionopaga]
MDLLKGPIREGSRGGRAEFKWSDVKDSKDREYYLGVSVKAPTGRWQQNRDVQWYSRDSSKTPDQAALDREKARLEEIKRIKESENDALSAALGFKVAKRQTEGDLSQGEVDKAIQEAGAIGDERDYGSNEKGIGFGRIGMPTFIGGDKDVMAGNAKQDDEARWKPAASRNAENSDGKGSRDDKRKRGEERDSRGKPSRHRHHRSRSRDREKDRYRRHRSRSRSRDRDRKPTSDRQRRDRSKSPARSPRHDRGERRERRDDERRRRHD